MQSEFRGECYCRKGVGEGVVGECVVGECVVGEGGGEGCGVKGGEGEAGGGEGGGERGGEGASGEGFGEGGGECDTRVAVRKV